MQPWNIGFNNGLSGALLGCLCQEFSFLFRGMPRKAENRWAGLNWKG